MSPTEPLSCFSKLWGCICVEIMYVFVGTDKYLKCFDNVLGVSRSRRMAIKPTRADVFENRLAVRTLEVLPAMRLQIACEIKSPNFCELATRLSGLLRPELSDFIWHFRPVSFACWQISHPGRLGS